MNGFEEAKERRNWLERLGDKIPGFRGFRDRELRRDVDRMQREHLSRELGAIKARARQQAQAYTDAGKIGVLHLFDRLDRRLDGLSQRVRFTDYGYSGFFDPVKINETELDRIYEFDLSLVDDLTALDGKIGAVPPPHSEDPTPALQVAIAGLAALEEKWAGRGNVISDVVKSSG